MDTRLLPLPSLEELAEHYDIFKQAQETNTPLATTEIQFWDLFLSRANIDLQPFVQNEVYQDFRTWATVTDLSDVEELQQLILGKPAALMLWLNAGYAAQNLPSLDLNFESPDRRESLNSSDNVFSSPLPAAKLSKLFSPSEANRSSPSNRVSSPVGPKKDKELKELLKCGKALSNSRGLSVVQLKYCQEFIEQVNRDWEPIAEKKIYSDFSTWGTVAHLADLDDLRKNIEGQPSLFLLWMNAGYEAENGSERGSQNGSPVVASRQGNGVNSPLPKTPLSKLSIDSFRAVSPSSPYRPSGSQISSYYYYESIAESTDSKLSNVAKQLSSSSSDEEEDDLVDKNDNSSKKGGSFGKPFGDHSGKIVVQPDRDNPNEPLSNVDGNSNAYQAADPAAQPLDNVGGVVPKKTDDDETTPLKRDFVEVVIPNATDGRTGMGRGKKVTIGAGLAIAVLVTAALGGYFYFTKQDNQ